MIHDATTEVFEKNEEIIKDFALKDLVRLAVEFSCATNINILQKLGLIDDEFKPLS